MSIITTQEQLMLHLPNTLKAVAGEKSLYEKIEGYLGAAERWLAQNICEASMISDEYDTKKIGEAVIVNHALYHAVPALDLVLTPNGFGIVNNQNVVPASKERVENLRKSLLENRDKNLMLLVHILASIDEWKNSPQGRWFGETMFPWIETVDEYSDEEIGCTGSYWERYVKLRTKIQEAEEKLEHKFFGAELMGELREASMKSAADVDIKVLTVAKQARMAVRALMGNRGWEKAHTFGRYAIEIIRNNPDKFTQWHESEMAEIWTPVLYENKKEDAGYFF